MSADNFPEAPLLVIGSLFPLSSSNFSKEAKEIIRIFFFFKFIIRNAAQYLKINGLFLIFKHVKQGMNSAYRAKNSVVP